MKFQKSRAVIALMLIAALSFALSVYWVSKDAASAFYLSPARFWELILGALLALRAAPSCGRVLSEFCSALGVALIALSIFGFTKQTAFPGINAVLPCLGAALFIYAGETHLPVPSRLLALRPFVFVGLISYSLYLWHWPLIVFARYYKLAELSTSETAAVIALSLAAAVVSWRFVEMPFRKAGSFPRRIVFPVAIGSAAAAIGLGMALNMVYGQSGLLAASAAPHIPGQEFYNKGPCFLLPGQKPDAWAAEGCQIVGGKAKTCLLWGDSFAAHLVPGLVASKGELAENIIQYTTSGCPPMFGVETPANLECVSFNSNAKKVIIESGVDVVVLVARWNYYLYPDDPGITKLQDTVSWIRAQGKQVIVIGQTPSFEFPDPYTYFTKTRSMTAEMPNFDYITSEIRTHTTGAVFIDPLQYFCREQTCDIMNVRGDYLFWDSGHLSVAGSTYLVRNIMRDLNSAGDP